MQRSTRYGFLGFVAVMAFVVSAMALAPVDASAQEDVPPPENSGTTSDPPPPPPPPPATEPPPPATQPPPPPATQPPPPPATEPPAATEPPPPATEPPPPPTEAPATETPAPTETIPANEDPIATDPATSTPPEATETVAPDATEIVTPEPTPDVVDPVPSEPPPAALGLPSPLPGSIAVVPGGGYNGLAIIWNYGGFGISQEFGRTAFSVANPTWYDYGARFGLDGVSHPGLDVSMPRGTWLYSPVSGTVVISGNSSGFTFYGNGNSGVGELRIRTANGDEVILGHMGRIAVHPGDFVTTGQFVGVSGGFNGDHLHVEARQAGRIVDPRHSFITTSIEATLQQPTGETGDADLDEDGAEEDVLETDPNPESGSEEPEAADQGLTSGSGDAQTDGGTGSPALAASLQGNAQRAGTWIENVDSEAVAELMPPDDDDIAAGLEESARRQPLPDLVPESGG